LTAVLDVDVVTGTLVLAPGGGFVYTPALNFAGVVTFTYHAYDGLVDSNIATAVISVTSVNDPPSISDIPDQVTGVGEVVGPVEFTVHDAEGVEGLLLEAATSDPGVVALGDILFGGSGVTRTITLTPTSNVEGGTALITVTVSDGSDSDDDVFAVIVEPYGVYLPLVLKKYP
jgi:hypothetical protein